MAELKWYGDKAKKVVAEAAKQAIGTCASDLQGKSAMQAPVDTGDLRANCSVGQLKQEGNTVYLTVGYNLPYAIVQHERLEFRHPKGGKAKYLENPYKENISKYEHYIKEIIRRALIEG